MNGRAPQALAPAEVGSPKRRTTRGAYTLTAAALAEAKRKYAAAEAAVAVAVTGADVRVLAAETGAEELRRNFLVGSILKLEAALSVYVAVVVLAAPRKALAPAIGLSLKRVRAYCRTVEAWREAPVIADALARVEAALPRGL